jgi:hypothetical protein
MRAKIDISCSDKIYLMGDIGEIVIYDTLQAVFEYKC